MERLAGEKSLGAERPALNLSLLHREVDLAAALIAGNHVELRANGLVQKLGYQIEPASNLLVLLCDNPPSALRQAQDERLRDRISTCCRPFVVSPSNHERTSDIEVLAQLLKSVSQSLLIFATCSSDNPGAPEQATASSMCAVFEKPTRTVETLEFISPKRIAAWVSSFPFTPSAVFTFSARWRSRL